MTKSNFLFKSYFLLTNYFFTPKNTLLHTQVRADEVDEQGNTALHLAMQGDHKEVCSLLLKRREGTMAVNKEGLTPLHVASSAGSLSCIQVVQSSIQVV